MCGNICCPGCGIPADCFVQVRYCKKCWDALSPIEKRIYKEKAPRDVVIKKKKPEQSQS